MIIGVDLGGTNIRAGIISGDKVVSMKHSLLTHKDSLSATLDQLISTIEPLILHGIKGIGVGVPSVVDIEKGIVYDVVNIPCWKKVELKNILEAEFNIPVFINNDVNCFALGEHRFGQGKGYRSIVALALGTGLGAGIIINNSLYCGINCGAGEIGSLPYRDSNFEFYTSSMFFESVYSTSAFKAHQDSMDKINGSEIIWNAYGTHLGNVIKAVMYTYDPEVIILGGSISKAYPFFETAMKVAMSDFQFPESLRRMKILRSQIDNIALLGAAALVKTD
jgi:glucokinase